MSLSDALSSDDANVGKLKVVSLLESLPGWGKVKARKVMEEIGIADNRRVQGLGSAADARHCSKPASELRFPGRAPSARSSSSPAPVESARGPSSTRSCGAIPACG